MDKGVESMKCTKASLGIVCLLASCFCFGCASGPKYDSVASSIPVLDSNNGQGRIFFYRDGSLFGAVVQTSVLLNEWAVGKSKAGSFFYIDVDEGECEVSCKTEAESRITFDLEAGETMYVRTRVEFGVLVGRIVPYLESEEVAMKTLPSTSYIGERSGLTPTE